MKIENDLQKVETPSPTAGVFFEKTTVGEPNVLSKREYIASMALQGYCSSAMPLEDKEIAEAARLSVKAADALLLKLAKMK